MKIIIGIFITIVIVFFAFLFERFKKRKEIEKEGGMKKKYQFLTKEFTEIGAEISQINTDSIDFIYDKNEIYWHYSIVQAGNNILITYFQKTYLGDLTHKWKFPETMNQELMILQMKEDIIKLGKKTF